MKKQLISTTVMLWMMMFAAAAFAEPSVLVKTGVLKEMSLPVSLNAYGVVRTDPRRVKNISLAKSGEVSQVMAAVGQTVTRGTPLLDFQTDPADSTAYRQAMTAVDFAQKSLQRTEIMVVQHLATQSQLAAAQKSLTDALAALDLLRKQGKGSRREELTAPFDGIVTRVDVRQGDRVAPGVSLLQLTPGAFLIAALGVEPENIHNVKLNMPVIVQSVFDPGQVMKGHVANIGGVINPQTRRMDVQVRLDDRSAIHFVPGMEVSGKIILKNQRCIAAPRSAVLRDDNGAYIFQVVNNRAVRINVVTGVENDQVVAVQGKINSNMNVVILGNYELHDNMAVREGAQ